MSNFYNKTVPRVAARLGITKAEVVESLAEIGRKLGRSLPPRPDPDPNDGKDQEPGGRV
jgi:hypothetical protein